MNPREIPECVASLEALPVDQAWLTGYTEAQLPINHVIEQTRYDRYSIISDDAVATPEAFAAVLAAHDQHPDAVVTGYSPLARDDPRVNLIDLPLEGEVGRSHIGLLALDDVRQRGVVFPTTFAGYAFTTATREVWLRCPHPQLGNANDFHQSQQFARAGIPILAARDGMVDHVKEQWNMPDTDPRKRLWIGFVQPEVKWRFNA